MIHLITEIAKRIVYRRATIVDIEHRSEIWKEFTYGDAIVVLDGKYENMVGEIIRPSIFRMKKLKVHLETGENKWFYASQLDLL